jgi:hypothetical protein
MSSIASGSKDFSLIWLKTMRSGSNDASLATADGCAATASVQHVRKLLNYNLNPKPCVCVTK